MEVENVWVGRERKVGGIEPVWNRTDLHQISRYNGGMSTLSTGKEDTHDFVTEVSERGVDSTSRSGTAKEAERKAKLDVVLEGGSAVV